MKNSRTQEKINQCHVLINLEEDSIILAAKEAVGCLTIRFNMYLRPKLSEQSKLPCISYNKCFKPQGCFLTKLSLYTGYFCKVSIIKYDNWPSRSRTVLQVLPNEIVLLYYINQCAKSSTLIFVIYVPNSCVSLIPCSHFGVAVNLYMIIWNQTNLEKNVRIIYDNWNEAMLTKIREKH